MNKSYVQQYVELERSHWWFLVREKIMLLLLSKNLPSGSLKILNIGAAGGASSEWLTAYGDVVSVETDIFFVDHLHRSGIDVIEAGITCLPFVDASFDLVCAFDVIEHVEDHQKALLEMHRICKDEGYICITVPAYQQLWSSHDVVNGHFRRYNFKQLKAIINQSISVEIKSWTYFNSILFIPILITRTFQKINDNQRQFQQSDFEKYKTGSFANKILYYLFNVEVTLLKYFRLPFGVSLFCFAKKR